MIILSHFSNDRTHFLIGHFRHLGNTDTTFKKCGDIKKLFEIVAFVIANIGFGTFGRHQVISLFPNSNRSEAQTSELQPLMRISYAVSGLNKKKKKTT